MESIPALRGQLAQSAQAVAAHTPPFAILQDQILEEFASFEARFPEDPLAALAAEYEMICWYIGNKQYMQAVSLAREWLIDVVCVRCGVALDFKTKIRENVEKGVSGLAKMNTKQQGRIFVQSDLNDYGVIFYTNLSSEEGELVKSIWNDVQPIRNAFSHPEHQVGGIGWQKAVKKVEGPILANIHRLHALIVKERL